MIFIKKTFTGMTRFNTHKHKKEFLDKRRRVLCDMKEIVLVREIKSYTFQHAQYILFYFPQVIKYIKHDIQQGPHLLHKALNDESDLSKIGTNTIEYIQSF